MLIKLKSIHKQVLTPKYILLCRGRITSLTLVRNICPQWVEKKHATIHYWPHYFFLFSFQWPMLSNDQWCGLPFGLKRPLSSSTFPAVREPRRLQACHSPAHCWMAHLLLTGGSIWAQEARDARDQTSALSLPLNCPGPTAPGQTSAQPSGAENHSTVSKKGAHAHTYTRMLWLPLELLSALSSCNFQVIFWSIIRQSGKAEHL